MQKNSFFLKTIRVILPIFALVNASIAPVYAEGFDRGFYNNNDILYYDPTAEMCTTTASSLATNTSEELSPEEKIAQLFIVGFDSVKSAEAKAAVSKYKLGGVYFNGRDVSQLAPTYFNDLNTGLPSHLLISSDDEGGQIERLVKGQPSAKQLGTMTNAQVLAAGKDMGTKLKAAGATTVLAPVLDIDTGKQNAISPYDRSFSSNPKVIAEKAGAWIDGVTSAGIGVTMKHFPGIGSNVGNTDKVYVSEARSFAQMTSDLYPYIQLKGKAKSAVMLANVALTDMGGDPVSINAKAVAYLKTTVGYNGLITTDDIGVFENYTGSHRIALPAAVSKALIAGVAMPLFQYKGDASLDAIIAAVKKDVSQPIIDAAYTSAIAYKNSLGFTGTIAPGTPGASSDACCPPSTSTSLIGEDNYKKIYNYFLGLGMKDFQAAAIVGSIYQESKGNPELSQKTQGNISDPSGLTCPPPGYGCGNAWGLIQWDPGSWAIKFAKEANITGPINTLETQLPLIAWHMKNSAPTSQKDVWSKMAATSTVSEAVGVWSKYFEACGKCNDSTRIEFANKVLSTYPKTPTTIATSPSDPGATATIGGGCSVGTTTSASDGSKATFITDDKFAIYSQKDPRWKDHPLAGFAGKTIGSSLCGFMSMANAATALTGKAIDIVSYVDKEVAAGNYQPGGMIPTGPLNIAPDLGVKATKLAWSEANIQQTLKSGGYVIVAGHGGVPYSSDGHYILIRGIASDGKYLIANSLDLNRAGWDEYYHSSQDHYTYTTLNQSINMGSVYAITK